MKKKLTPRGIEMCPASAREDVKGATQVAPAKTKVSRIPGITETTKEKNVDIK